MIQLLTVIFLGIECYRRAATPHDVWRNIAIGCGVVLFFILAIAALSHSAQSSTIMAVYIICQAFISAVAMVLVGWGAYAAKRLIRRGK